MTTDLARVREWLQSWTDVSGVEGILVKNMSQHLTPAAPGRPWEVCASPRRGEP
ncbi:hypothetical protein AB0F20_01440 [Streptomyces goshikiensis]|uniref:hypothetical protein n=1 Tax=Streptomyces goshikiensis TaxID=1942 RepID=UPI00340FDA2C